MFCLLFCGQEPRHRRRRSSHCERGDRHRVRVVIFCRHGTPSLHRRPDAPATRHRAAAPRYRCACSPSGRRRTLPLVGVRSAAPGLRRAGPVANDRGSRSVPGRYPRAGCSAARWRREQAQGAGRSRIGHPLVDLPQLGEAICGADGSRLGATARRSHPAAGGRYSRRGSTRRGGASQGLVDDGLRDSSQDPRRAIRR